MSTIPISQIVQVNPGVLAAAGSAVDLNGLILSESDYLPTNTAVPFSSAADVKSYFGPTSTEGEMAVVYFNGFANCTRLPGKLYFYRRAVTSVSAFLRGGSLASMTLDQLKQLSGTLTITIDGTEVTAGSLAFGSVTSFSEAATQIGTALNAPVVYDSLHSAFIIHSPTTGATSTITEASGTLAADLKLTAATGAMVSQGLDPQTPAQTMDGMIAQNQNWGCFTTTTESDLTSKQAFTDWTNGQNERYAYVGYDSNEAAKTAGSTGTWGDYLKTVNPDGSIPLYASYLHAAFVLGFAASLDFTRLNGRQTLAFRYQSGLLPSVTNGTDASNLESNGYNFYGTYANSGKQEFTFMYPGAISGKWKWIDTYLNQIWLNANLQLSMVTLLMNVGSVPYNAQGYALIEAACQDPINAALNYGAIRTGVQLSDAQKAEIQFALGFDASQAIQSKGYYLQIMDATAATRAERASPPMTLYYADGGSIQRLTLASIAIQ